jgi:hypothetical protein
MVRNAAVPKPKQSYHEDDRHRREENPTNGRSNKSPAEDRCPQQFQEAANVVDAAPASTIACHIDKLSWP